MKSLPSFTTYEPNITSTAVETQNTKITKHVKSEIHIYKTSDPKELELSYELFTPGHRDTGTPGHRDTGTPGQTCQKEACRSEKF